jgi:hypothetical protein
MLHSRRTWFINPVVGPDWLADQLCNHTSVGCQAFELDGYVYANDSTSGDGAQEYAVLLPISDGEFIQIESITFSWCSVTKAREYIACVSCGQFNSNHYGVISRSRFQTMAEHGHCQLCI